MRRTGVLRAVLREQGLRLLDAALRSRRGARRTGPPGLRALRLRPGSGRVTSSLLRGLLRARARRLVRPSLLAGAALGRDRPRASTNACARVWFVPKPRASSVTAPRRDRCATPVQGPGVRFARGRGAAQPPGHSDRHASARDTRLRPSNAGRARRYLLEWAGDPECHRMRAAVSRAARGRSRWRLWG